MKIKMIICDQHTDSQFAGAILVLENGEVEIGDEKAAVRIDLERSLITQRRWKDDGDIDWGSPWVDGEPLCERDAKTFQIMMWELGHSGKERHIAEHEVAFLKRVTGFEGGVLGEIRRAIKEADRILGEYNWEA